MFLVANNNFKILSQSENITQSTERHTKIINFSFTPSGREGHVGRGAAVLLANGGREGIHTEHLGHMLSDMQYLQRAYPNAKW